MVLTITIPRGVPGKEPPHNRERPDQSPPDPPAIRTPGTNQFLGDTNIALLRQMIERTERGNVRIRKLNELKRQRRLESADLCEVSDSEEEEPMPNISSFAFHSSIPTHIPSLSNEASGSNAIGIGPRVGDASQALDTRTDPAQLGNADWQALINAQDQIPDPKLAKSDYVDYSVLGPAFKLDEASKNIHELDPSVIPNALKQMAHCRVFIPLSMFTTQALKTIHDNVGDLYTKKKTGLSVGKCVLNSDCFLSEDTLTKQTFSKRIETGSNS